MLLAKDTDELKREAEAPKGSQKLPAAKIKETMSDLRHERYLMCPWIDCAESEETLP